MIGGLDRPALAPEGAVLLRSLVPTAERSCCPRVLADRDERSSRLQAKPVRSARGTSAGSPAERSWRRGPVTQRTMRPLRGRRSAELLQRDARLAPSDYRHGLATSPLSTLSRRARRVQRNGPCRRQGLVPHPTAFARPSRTRCAGSGHLSRISNASRRPRAATTMSRPSPSPPSIDLVRSRPF